MLLTDPCRKQDIECRRCRSHVNEPGQDLHQGALRRRQANGNASDLEGALAARKPVKQDRHGHQDRRTDHLVYQRPKRNNPRNPGWVDDKRNRNQDGKGKPDCQPGCTDDAANIGNIDAFGGVNPVSKCTAGQQRKPQRIGNCVSGAACHCGNVVRHPARCDRFNSNDIIEGNSRETHYREEQRGQEHAIGYGMQGAFDIVQ